MPLAFFIEVLKMVVERLQDKGSNVRARALQCLQSVIKNNPYAPKLDNISALQPQHAEAYLKRSEMIKEFHEIHGLVQRGRYPTTSFV